MKGCWKSLIDARAKPKGLLHLLNEFLLALMEKFQLCFS